MTDLSQTANRDQSPPPPAALPAAPRRVAIVGGTGYTGALTAELVLGHRYAELTCISSERSAGVAVREFDPRLRCDLAFCRESDVHDVDVAFICTPHGEAARVAKRLLDEGARVIDLSADFRLPADLHAEWYGEHPYPQMLPGVYGLTELHRDEVATADLVANPGCYPTAALLALTPLKKYGLTDVVIDAKSGVSGAGKSPSARTHFCSIDSDVVAYGLQGHRHFPEIAVGLNDGNAPSVTFIPHLVPLQRGIVETIYARTEIVPSAEDLRAHFRAAYANETVDERAGRIIVVAALDNLMKGAAGQALQNMNVMLGLPEHLGLV
jgi:N-acetyl-gamma-glutamyl-phosphate reductase